MQLLTFTYINYTNLVFNVQICTLIWLRIVYVLDRVKYNAEQIQFICC